MAALASHLINGVEDRGEIPPFALLAVGDDTNRLFENASIQCGVSKDLIEDIYPCSPMQQGLMALSIKEPSAYVIQLVYSCPHH